MTREQDIRQTEAMIRYSHALPPRDDTDRTAYKEWATLDAESPGFAVWGRSRQPSEPAPNEERIRDLAEKELDEKAERVQRLAALDRRRQAERAQRIARGEPELEPPF